MLTLLLPAALAAGFYHPDDIARASKRFAEAGASAGAVFEDRQRDAKLLAQALGQYELALDLLGDRAPVEERGRLAALRKEYQREFAVLDAFATTMMDDFDAEFRAALDRALKKHTGATECAREVVSGPKMPGIPTRTKANAACEGADLNGELARALDADPLLKAAVDEILGLRWPDVALDPAPQAPIGVGERTIDVARYLEELAPTGLREIDAQDREAREPFEVKLEQGASKEELAALVDEAHAIAEATAGKRAALASPALAAAEKTFAKWSKKGAPATAFCANPAELGACSAPDATRELLPALLQEKKVAKLAE